jgi:hypothetical protein
MQAHILLERALPLSWTVLPEEAPSLTPDNHLLFSLLDKLEEPVAHNMDAETANELFRIDAKLNIIMQLLGQVLQNRQPLPAATTIRFSSDSLAWQVAAPPPSVGSRMQISLYPDPGIPLAITFTARVREVAEPWMEVDMHGLHEEELAIWSRWVFRQHRRQIAQARLPLAESKHSK